jgi:hypothetical protein
MHVTNPILDVFVSRTDAPWSGTFPGGVGAPAIEAIAKADTGRASQRDRNFWGRSDLKDPPLFRNQISMPFDTVGNARIFDALN